MEELPCTQSWSSYRVGLPEWPGGEEAVSIVRPLLQQYCRLKCTPAWWDGIRRNEWPLLTSYVFNILQFTYTQIRICRIRSRGFEDGLQSAHLGPGSQIGPKRPIEYMAKCCIQRLLYGKVLYSLYGKVPIEAKRKEKVSTGCNANSYLYICRHGINTSLTYQSHWHTCMDELSISSCDHFHAKCFLKVYYCYRSRLKHKSLA